MVGSTFVPIDGAKFPGRISLHGRKEPSQREGGAAGGLSTTSPHFWCLMWLPMFLTAPNMVFFSYVFLGTTNLHLLNLLSLFS